MPQTLSTMLLTLATAVMARQYVGAPNDGDIVYDDDAAQGIGVIYGVVGPEYVARALLSAETIAAPRVVIFTGCGTPCEYCVQVTVANSSFSASRIVKIMAIMQSPFRVTLFLDSDVIACLPFADLVGLLETRGRPRIETSRRGLMDAFDVMVAMARAGIKKDTNPSLQQVGRPPGFSTVNSGVIFYRNRPRVKELWRHWLKRYLSHDHSSVNVLDQPDLALALYDAVAVERDPLRLYVLGPHWNMKKWRDDYFTSIGSTCCPSNLGILIDHGCDLGPRHRAAFRRIREMRNLTHARWVAD